MSDTQPPKDPPKELPPLAPKFGELMELSLTALANAPGVFTRLTERPVPGPGGSLLAALSWGAAFFALNLVRVGLSYPAELQAVAPWKIGAVFAAALGVWTALYLLFSSVVYGLGRALGSSGDFDRALLVAAITLATAPLQALCGWFPMAWVAPALVAAWILACGLSTQFKADPWAARGVCAVLAGGALALQYGAGLAAEKYAGPARIAASAAQGAPSPEQMNDLQKQMDQIQAIALEAQNNAQDGSSAGDASKASQSSLDLLRGPAGEEAASPGPTDQQRLAQMSASGDAMNKSVIAMLDSLGPMLNNPMITQNFSAEQKADYAELTKMIADLKAGMAANSITSQKEHQAKMMKIQGLVMRLMSAGIQRPKAPSAPPAGGKP